VHGLSRARARARVRARVRVRVRARVRLRVRHAQAVEGRVLLAHVEQRAPR